MSRCYIVGAGEFCADRFFPETGAFIIAADGGYEHLMRAGVKPDLLVGDFDSLGSIPEGVETIRYPAEKDATDMALAVSEAYSRGYRQILIYGGTGARLDHTFANTQLLADLAQKGVRGILVGESCNITAVSDSSISFAPREGDTVSVFCNGASASGVYLSGLKYPLTDATLTACNPIGVSNEFIGPASKIEVRSGTLIVIWTGESELPLD